MNTSKARWFAALAMIAIYHGACEPALAQSAGHVPFQPNLIMMGWLTVLICLSISYLIFRQAMSGRRSIETMAQWPITDGTVVSASVAERVHESEISFSYYIPRVRYEYELNGIRCQGAVVRAGLDDVGYLREERARDHIALYPVGTKIQVRYDPRDPKTVVLETEQPGNVVKALTGAACFAGLGLSVAAIVAWSARVPI
ncbi:MAG: DUF3592 domain-containing protein [Pseudolabrys sp.]|nr:DUF3592 domain-containing protein [Pseudolabrys sp.]